MENKPPKDRIRDTYGNEVDSNISFDEYWSREDRITDMSYKESVRAKEYREKWHSDITQIHVKVCAKCGNEECICKYFDEAKQCNTHTQAKLEDGECCQTKTKKK